MVESRTKISLTDSQVEDLVGHAFGGARLRSVRELTDGYFNTCYDVQLDADPGRVVLKVGPPSDADILSYEADLMRTEIEAMKLVATDPGIPVPPVVFEDLTRTRLPFDYFFMGHAPGRTWDKVSDGLPEERNSHIEAELGRITARVNGFERAAFGYPGFGPEFGRWADAFRWMCELLFADARRYDITLDVTESEYLALFDRYGAIFEAVTRPQLVHWDLWAGNVFVSVEGEQPSVTAIIDFERAIWGDPLMEFIPGRLRDIDAYVAGYGADLLATRSQRLRRIFYNLYLGLVLVVEDGPRQYAVKSTVEWGRGLLQRNLAMLRHGDVIAELSAYA